MNPHASYVQQIPPQVYQYAPAPGNQSPYMSGSYVSVQQPPVQPLVRPHKSEVTAKLYLPKDEIRRVTINRQATYEQLLQQIVPYVNLDRNKKLDANDLKLYYQDQEKEYIRFDSNDEWKEALLDLVFTGTLKLCVKLRVDKKKKATKRNAPKPAPVLKEEDLDLESTDDEEVPPTKSLTPILPEVEMIPKYPQAPVTSASVPSMPQPTTSTDDDALRKTNANLRASFSSSISGLLQNKPQYTQSPQSSPAFPVPQYLPQDSVSSRSPQQQQQPQQQQPLFREVTSSGVPPPQSPQQQQQQAMMMKSENNNFEGLLKELNDMGFSDRQKNMELLQKHNGHLLNVINALMEQ